MLDYQQQQAAFAAYLRHPEQHAAPANIEQRRLQIYRDVFYNNIENFISSGFPVLKSLFAEESWHELVRHFYATHTAHTPYFLEISEEFLAYLDNDALPVHRQFPFARALAHYEWVELALDIADEHNEVAINPAGDIFSGVPVLSSLAWPLVYEWPVHLIGKEFQPLEVAEQPVCLVVYRNSEDRVEFMEANPVTMRLLEIISEGCQLTGEQVLMQIAQEMQQADVGNIMHFGLPVLEQLRALGIIAGTVLA